jgi:hypothetical protein
MGSSIKATTNYPAAILGGLWTNANNVFQGTPWGGQVGQNQYGFQPGTYATANAGNQLFNLINSYNQNPGGGYNQNAFGYNPYESGFSANQLTGLNASLTPFAEGENNNLLEQGYDINSFLQGQGRDINSALQGFAGPLMGGLEGAGQDIYGRAIENTAGLQGYANQALTNAFDPQQALYNKTFQQQHEQALANQAQSGTATTPYGAGISTTGDQNFDIAWQQSQLANQAQGANTASALLGQSANQLGLGLNALTGAYGTAANIGQGLYGTGANALQGLYGTGANALQGLAGTGGSNLANLVGAGTNAFTAGANAGMMGNQYGQGQLQQQIQDYLSFLSGSSGNSANYINALTQLYNASTGQYSAANTAAANQANLNAGGLSGLGQGLGGILGGLSKFLPFLMA